MIKLTRKLGLGLACVSVLIVFTKCAFMQKNGPAIIHLAADTCLALTEDQATAEGKALNEVCATEEELRPLVSTIAKRRALAASVKAADAGAD